MQVFKFNGFPCVVGFKIARRNCWDKVILFNSNSKFIFKTLPTRWQNYHISGSLLLTTEEIRDIVSFLIKFGILDMFYCYLTIFL